MEGFSLYVFEFLKDFCEYFIYDWVLLFFILGITVAFLTLFIWSCCSRNMRLKSKGLYLVACISSSLLFACYSILVRPSSTVLALFYPIIIAIISLILYAILLIQSKIKVKLKKVAVNTTPQTYNFDNVQYICPAPKVEATVKQPVLNTTYLKKLVDISMQNQLDANEKKSIELLKESIKEYDSGNDTFKVKQSINNGVNNLMRIISQKG